VHVYGNTVRNASAHPAVRIGKIGSCGALRRLEDDPACSTLVPCLPSAYLAGMDSHESRIPAPGGGLPRW